MIDKRTCGNVVSVCALWVGCLLCTAGTPTLSGEVHAQRVPGERWRHRLEVIKGLGMNCVSTYVLWNQIEPEPGRWDWSGRNDIAAFCKMAETAGLKVIVRPGPYVCGEADFGGLPSWLLKDNNMRLRSSYPGFLEPARRYLMELGKRLAPLQATRGGPIIMVQVENEYSDFGADSGYIASLCDALRESGIEVPLFSTEMAGSRLRATNPAILRAIGFADNPDRSFAILQKTQPEGMLFCSELYTGWFDMWGRESATGMSSDRVTQTLDRVLDLGASFNLYMAHGGTSFGFMAGANNPPFRPQPTSYDYGAPIDEAGRPTEKYFAIRRIMEKHLKEGQALPPVPEVPPTIAIPTVAFGEVADLTLNLGSSVHSKRPQSMEVLGQGHGCILYRTTLPAGKGAELELTELHDFAVVSLDGKPLGTIDRMRQQKSLWLPEREDKAVLDILVEAMGHVNYGPTMVRDRKGITERAELRDGSGRWELFEWDMFLLPLDPPMFENMKSSTSRVEGPAYYRATFDVAKTGDTFLDMRQWGKGYVWVNGHNLGRYWNIGPQQTLYLPGPWLKRRANEIVVLDLLGPRKAEIAGLTNHILNMVVPEPGAIPHRKPGQRLLLDGVEPVARGAFTNGTAWQTVRFDSQAARYVCFCAKSSLPRDDYSTCAELVILDGRGQPVPMSGLKIAYADSEESRAEDALADRAIDGRPETFWHTSWSGERAPLPHQVVVDLGTKKQVSGIRYLPRQDRPNGRIGAYEVFLSEAPFPGL